MQEESRLRYGLAQQIAPHYHTNPQVAAMLVEGSVAGDTADRSSDLDLAVFWARPPAAHERRDIVIRAGGSGWRPSPSRREATGWSERYELEGVPIDVRHTTVAATEDLLAAVLKGADPRLARQQRLAALRSALLPGQPSTHHPLAATGSGLSAHPGRGNGPGIPALSPIGTKLREKRDSNELTVR